MAIILNEVRIGGNPPIKSTLLPACTVFACHLSTLSQALTLIIFGESAKSIFEMDLHVHLLALLTHHLKHCNFMNIYILVGAILPTLCKLKSRSFGSYSTPANIAIGV